MKYDWLAIVTVQKELKKAYSQPFTEINAILIGHNIKSSDLYYITKAARKAGVIIENPFLDTYILTEQFKNSMGWEKVNLEYLSEYFGIEH